MKRLLVVCLLILCFSSNMIKALNKKNCLEEIILESVNSKELLNYIYDNNLLDKIVKVCSSDMCSNIDATKLETEINNFINKNIKYLTSINEENGINASLKGFKIDKIIINSCL